MHAEPSSGLLPPARAPGACGPPLPPFPFEAFRRERFGDAPACPRCDAPRVVRWGTFSGRQRYRCNACRRTFSDFTHTPLAYLKRIECWPEHAACVREARSLRATAACLGIHPATAFRWRHLLLRALDAADRALLDETVTLGETPLHHSEKGRRDLQRPPRRRGRPRNTAGWPSVWVLVARGASGRLASTSAGLRRPDAADFARLLLPRLGPHTRLLRRNDGLRGPETFARNHRVPLHPADFHQRQPVSDYVMRFRSWLRRFRGVATRYLPSYLVWHRFLDWTRHSPPPLADRLLLLAAFP